MRFLDATAFGKHLGKQNIENLFKVSQAHPADQHSAIQYATGPQAPEEQAAKVETEEYYRRLRQLYEQIYNAASGGSGTASEKATQVLSVPQ